MIFEITILLLVLATVAYKFYLFSKDGENAFDAIPTPFRWIYLPCYVISCIYITGLLLQWGLIVPGFFQWVLNITLYLLDWKLIMLINQIISDLMYTPVLAMLIFLPCIFPRFKSDVRFTYIFRLVTLVSLVVIHIYTINFFDMGDAVEGLDMFIYDVALAVAAYLTFCVIRDEYLGNGEDTGDGIVRHLKVLWDEVKRFFSKENRLLKQHFILLLLMFVVVSCRLHDGPPKTDHLGAVPEPHNGVFVCGDDTLFFNGDGKTVGWSFSTPLDSLKGKGEGTYVFKLYNGRYRYDAAEEVSIYEGTKSHTFMKGGETTENQISIYVSSDGDDNKENNTKVFKKNR